MASKREAWLSLLPGDPRPALLASDEPFARFVAMTALLGMSEDDAEVRSTRKAVVADPGVRALVERLPGWESGFTFNGHWGTRHESGPTPFAPRPSAPALPRPK